MPKIVTLQDGPLPQAPHYYLFLVEFSREELTNDRGSIKGRLPIDDLGLDEVEVSLPYRSMDQVLYQLDRVLAAEEESARRAGNLVVFDIYLTHYRGKAFGVYLKQERTERKQVLGEIGQVFGSFIAERANA